MQQARNLLTQRSDSILQSMNGGRSMVRVRPSDSGWTTTSQGSEATNRAPWDKTQAVCCCCLYCWFPSLFPVYPVRSPVAHSRSTARGVVGALQRALQHLPKVTGCPDFPRRRTENIRFGPAVWQAPQRADKVGLFRVFLLGTMITYFTFSWCGLPFLLGLPREY